ncbi:VCBS repeat-containing protein [Lentzea sp. NBC_00516]|uniref:FG-GAP repeat domain-containing protein n=1 Tax=Lentzea sp. NBC_00516 TaxID=2903582 RepID=UPI002E823F67|nr:VCBS repeat-containing protein [Lentzea sp. NBC_00516]WUD21268.1 VCBS repeat-containing protein [Lentzea sp. NBC_00516]
MTAVITGGATIAHATPGDAPGVQDADEVCVIPPNRDLNVTKIVYQVARDLSVSDKVMLAGFEAGWVESRMNNVPCGHLDSVGVFQQRPSQGWGTPEQIMDVTYASRAFFQSAISVDRANPGLSAGRLAQKVQRSDYPERYDQAEGTARTLLAEVAIPADRVSDVNRDGWGDLIAVDGNGQLFGYNNATLVSGDRKPFTSETWRYAGSDWTGTKLLASGDVTGDGYADLVATGTDGTLSVYGNGSQVNPGGKPFGGVTWTYQGSWADVRQLAIADVTGDGWGDLVAVEGSGALVVYANGSKVNPGGKPFGGETYRLGVGWGNVKHLGVADLNRDGFGDLVAVDGNGELFGYNNATLVSGDRKPFTGETWRIRNSNWSAVKQFTVMDASGDGYADIVAVEPDGKLSVYANGSLVNPGGVPYAGVTWSIGGDWSQVRTFA